MHACTPHIFALYVHTYEFTTTYIHTYIHSPFVVQESYLRNT